MQQSDKETSGNSSKPVYDKLQPKPVAPNQQSTDEKTLQQRLQDYKKDPTGKPWENAFEKLLNDEQQPGEFC